MQGGKQLGVIPYKNRHNSHFVPLMAEMPLAVAVSSQSLLHTLLHRYYQKSTVWVTCGKRNFSTVCIEYKSLMYLHVLLRALSAEHIQGRYL